MMQEYERVPVVNEAMRHAFHYARPFTAVDGMSSPKSPAVSLPMCSPRPTTAPHAFLFGRTTLASPQGPLSGNDENGMSLEDRFPFLRDDRKRTRKLLSQDQTRLLEAILERTVYPSTPLREAIARYLGISPRKVQIWFQNKRQISRRYAHNGPVRGCGGSDQSSPLMTRGRRATEGSDSFQSSERLMRFRDAEEDLRLAGLVDGEGRPFPELHHYSTDRDTCMPATAIGDAPWSEHFHANVESDAHYIDILRAQNRIKEAAAVHGKGAMGQHAHRESPNAGNQGSLPLRLDANLRILPPPRQQSFMTRKNARLAGRTLASLSDIALCHPEQVPALMSPTTPTLLSPIVFRQHGRTLTTSSDICMDSLASRTDGLRCDSPTSSSSSTMASPTTPQAMPLGQRVKSERCEALPSISTLIFDD